MQLLADGRFTLGLGAGENLNEHGVGEGWPSIDARQDMLVEAIGIIRELHTGELVTYDGEYFRVDSARIWDLPDGGVPIAVAVSGVEAHDQFRWFAGGWAVNADLPTTGFAGATQFVRPEDVAGSIPCGPDVDAVVEAVSAYWEAGFTDIALVQIGDDGQQRFLAEAAPELLDALRDAAPNV